MKKKIGYIFLALIFLPCLILLSACRDVEGYRINFIVDDEIYEQMKISQNDTIIVPQNPTKEGYEFDGWYWDKDGFVPYTTNSLLDMPLEKDMNVYAKFTKPCEHVDSEWIIASPATCEDEGLEKIICLKCEAIIETRTIEAKGHQLSDWITVKNPSINETGIMKRKCLNCVYFETQDIPIMDVVIPTYVEVEHGILKWNGESNYGFDVIVNDSSYIVYENELEVNLNAFDYNNVKVAGRMENGEKTKYVELKDFVVNAPITNLHYTDDGSNVTFTWDSPSDLYDYTFIVGETENTVDKNVHSYTVARSSLECGSIISVFVQGMDVANFYPSKKNTITLQQLDAPNLFIDKLSIAWSDVAGADNYKVKALTTETITNTVYSYEGASAGEHTITVTACGKDYLSNYATYTFNKLVCPTIFTYYNKTISWEQISGQLKYDITINDQEMITNTGNNYRLTNLEENNKINIYATAVLPNIMQSDITNVEIDSSYILNESNNYILIINDKDIERVNLSDVTMSITLIASKVPIGLQKGLIQNIIIPNGTTAIVNSAFSECANAKTLIIPESVTSIGDKAFYNCTSLKTINYNAINCSDFNASSDVFYGTGQTEITVNIGENVEKIPAYLFYSRYSSSYLNPEITSVLFAENSKCKSIGSSAFEGCKFLRSIIIPESVTSIGVDAFWGCTSLTRVYYGGDVDDWNNISINSNNNYLTNATRYYYSDGEPANTGNYWHYVDGVVTEWKKY